MNKKTMLIYFVLFTAGSILLFASTPIPSLQIIDTDKPIITSVGLTVNDLLISFGLLAATLSIWHFFIKKRI